MRFQLHLRFEINRGERERSAAFLVPLAEPALHLGNFCFLRRVDVAAECFEISVRRASDTQTSLPNGRRMVFDHHFEEGDLGPLDATRGRLARRAQPLRDAVPRPGDGVTMRPLTQSC